ncbi:DUF6263 family protein [Candidatus Palauibacter sp.]|uniref:DUF6263 family protein n=1 Tax=Candidatus Palauibacter sp. TaxID=3101350 RepID=UPI003B597705
MKSGIRSAAAFATLALTAALPLSGQATLLRIVPPEGQVSRYALSMESRVESPMMPSSDPVLTLRAHETQTILSVAGGVIRMRTTMDSVAMTAAMPGADMMPDLSGTTYTAEMDTRGRMLGLVDGEELPDDIEMMIEGMLENSDYFLLPENEVGPGDSWTGIASVGLPMGDASMAAETELTHTFVSLDGNLATISFEGSVEMNLDMGGMAMEATGDLAGESIIDLAEGRYVSQETRMNLDMVAAGMAMTSETTTTMALVPDP